MALVKRQWQGSPLCCVCNKPETANHIIFECVVAQYIWCCVRDAFNLQNFPLSIQELISQWLPRRLGISKRLCLTMFAGLAWAIWKNRNKMAIEKCLPLNPDGADVGGSTQGERQEQDERDGAVYCWLDEPEERRWRILLRDRDDLVPSCFSFTLGFRSLVGWLMRCRVVIWTVKSGCSVKLETPVCKLCYWLS